MVDDICGHTYLPFCYGFLVKFHPEYDMLLLLWVSTCVQTSEQTLDDTFSQKHSSGHNIPVKGLRICQMKRGGHLSSSFPYLYVNQGLTKGLSICLYFSFCPKTDLIRDMKKQQANNNAVLIKFFSPEKLKKELSDLASERNIALSALLRIIASNYIRRSKQQW